MPTHTSSKDEYNNEFIKKNWRLIFKTQVAHIILLVKKKLFQFQNLFTLPILKKVKFDNTHSVENNYKSYQLNNR